MLKFMIIYSVFIVASSIFTNFINAIEYNNVKKRRIYITSVILECPILYVLIKMLGML